MKKRKDWNTFFAIEKNLAYEPSMQTTKELAGLRLNVAAAKHSASLSFGALIRKQLAAWYLCPALLAAVISGKMILFAGERFVLMTGVPVPEGAFFLKSLLLFLGIYLVYFGVTDVTFKRNIG